MTATLIRSLLTGTLLLCLTVVVLGAYVRLSDAGLSCPDWPGCYGHLSPSGAAADARVLAQPPSRALSVGKAWREMLHRYAAGTLGLAILFLTIIALRDRRQHGLPPGYMLGLLALVAAQGLLGMLTVTRQLEPLIVTLHLLFGCTTLALLWWLLLSFPDAARRRWVTVAASPVWSGAQRLALLALLVLAVQIALGGWTSSHYAATACPDFPMCQGQWWPEGDSRATIQLSHRLGALASAIVMLGAGVMAWRLRLPATKRAAAFLLAALALQLGLGVTMVLLGFPLWLRTLHNAGAALLLLAIVGLNRVLRPLA